MIEGVIMKSRIKQKKTWLSLNVFLLLQITFLSLKTHIFRIIEKHIGIEINPSCGLENATFLIIMSYFDKLAVIQSLKFCTVRLKMKNNIILA